MKSLSISGSSRTEVGKKSTNALRHQGLVPCCIYGEAKDENGKDCYYIVATDMDAMQGWVSNHAIIFWKSYDLINWEDEHVLDLRSFEGWA